MATAVVVPPASPPTPVLTAATPLGIPAWAQEPTGTWYIRIAFADLSDPLTLTGMSVLSNELSFVVDNAPNGAAIINWTAVAGYAVVIFLSQTPGSYFDANGHVALQPSPLQLAGNGFGAGDVSSVSGFTVISAGNGQAFAAQNLLADLSSSLVPSGPYVVSGGTAGDRLSTQDIVDAINLLPGESVTEFGDQGAGSVEFDMARNAYLLERGITFSNGYWDLKSEGLYMRGSLVLENTAGFCAVRMGEETVDGSRNNGPDVGFMVRPESIVGVGVADIAWDPDELDIYSARLFSMHRWIGADVGGVDPDPTNDWIRGGLPHGFATSVDIPSGALVRYNTISHTYDVKSSRIEGFTIWNIARGIGADIVLDADEVVGVDLGELSQAFAATISNIRLENTRDGFVLRTTLPGTPTLDSCRVVSSTVSELRFQSSQTTDWTILDCTFDEAADDNDPVVELGILGITGGVTATHIVVSHRLDVQVVDHLGAAVSGAGVSLIHAGTAATVFDVTTAATGRIATQVVDRDKWESVAGVAGTPSTLSAHEAAGRIQNLLGGLFRLTVTVSGREPLSVLIDPDRPLSYIVTTTTRGEMDLRVEVEIPLAVAAEVAPIEIGAVVDPSEIGVEIE